MGQRPPHVKPPAHWTRSEPAPEPEPNTAEPPPAGKNGLEPTRYGDWEHGEHGGRIVDF